ncbi:MAG: type VI secretion system-associated protein TagF [Caulobacteraceae bacterium]|nr:type VI secretion system-associated protein TagF [Caulobacteraceae bacterium]
MRIVLFGKLPSHGDFVARGLDAPARAAWDGWLSEGMAGARAALGEAFDAAYEAAPPWRFVTGPGPFGESWRAGTLTPSVDAVGRRFPVILAVEGLAEDEVRKTGASVAAAMDDAIRDAFEGLLTADAAVQAAEARVAATAEAVPTEAPAWWTEGGEPLASPGPAASDLLARLWTPSVSERAA